MIAQACLLAIVVVDLAEQQFVVQVHIVCGPNPKVSHRKLIAADSTARFDNVPRLATPQTRIFTGVKSHVAVHSP